MENINELVKYLRLYKKSLIIVLLSLTIVALSLLLMGHIIRQLIDQGLGSHNIHLINSSLHSLIILIIIFAVGSFLRSYYINYITEKVISQLKIDTYENLLKINLEKFEELKISEILSRLTIDIENTGKLITNFLSFLIRNSVMLFGSLCLMIFQSPKLSILVIIAIPILLIPLIKLSKFLRNLSKNSLQEQSNLTNIIEENFYAIRLITAYNQQNYAVNELTRNTNTYLEHSRKRLKYRAFFFALVISLISCTLIAVIWIGSLDIINSNMSSGQLVSFIYYAIMAGVSAGGIAELFSELQSPLASLARVLELRFMPYKKLTNINNNNINLTNYDIECNKIKFSYPSRPNINVLDSLAFHIIQGQFIAIVGKSGSGKSTIMQLLLKFYDYNHGTIKIGGIDIKNLDENQIRSKIAYVEQEPKIFTGTIKSNISFSNQNVSEKEINFLAQICGILDFTNTLPDGLNTQIGEKGIRLSGGQKQKIALARALLYKPEILMLDEATSAIDSADEAVILINIRKLLQGKTIITIAHRISSIEEADKILVMNKGKIAANGTHHTLLNKSKIYNNLYKKQTLVQQENK